MDKEKKLEQYRKKRDFAASPEPRVKIGEASSKPVFVVQEHHATHLHYDFRLEIDGVLKSWAVPKGPSSNPKDKRLAVLTEDHPLAYKDFEGEIPEGQYGAGQVYIWDRGTYQNLRDISMAESFQDGKIEISLAGEKLQGGYVLIRTKGYGKQVPNKSWLLIKKR